MKYPKEFVGIRGLTASYVLLHHALGSLPTSYLGRLLENSYGVKLFMIVSGFSIYWLLESRGPSYGRFITGRFFRVFPVYIVGLIVYSLMFGFMEQTFEDAPKAPLNSLRLDLIHTAQANFPAHFLTHLTLLQGAVPQKWLPQSSFTIISQAWSLTVEWQLYLVAPFVIAWLSSIEKVRSQIAMVALIAVLLWAGRKLPPAFLGNNLEMFSVGLMSYLLAKHAAAGASAGTVRSYLAAMLILTGVWDANSLPPVIVWVATLYGVLAIDRNRAGEKISALLRSRPLMYLGQMSYSFYIFHILAIVMCLRVIDRLGTPAEMRYVLLPAAAFVLTVLFADTAFRLIEQPFHRFGKSLTRRDSTLQQPVEPLRESYAGG